jgi:hypothetical protein
MERTLIVIFLLCKVVLLAQSGDRLSRYEKRWAVFHPFAAVKIKKLHTANLPVYMDVKNKMLLDAYESGGKLDAFRHSFFMAVFAQNVKIGKLRRLGQAHEKGNYLTFLKRRSEYGELPDSLSSVMDLRNNELGFSIGRMNKNLPTDQLSQKVIEALKKGEGVYLQRNSSGQFVTCRGEVLKVEGLERKWFIPKCLIPTNQ